MKADFYDYEELKKAYLHRINCCFKEENGLDNFQMMNEKTLSKLVKEQNLMVEELELFKQIHLWSEAECDRLCLEKSVENKRLVLNGILSNIRFPIISLNEFNNIVGFIDLLTTDELLSIYRWFALDIKPEIKFSSLPRIQLSEKTYELNRFPQIDLADRFNRNCNRISFTVDRDVYLTGFYVFPAKDATESEDKAMLTFNFFSNKVLYHKMEVPVPFEESGKSSFYAINTPIPIKAEEPFEMEAKCTHNLMFFNGKGCKSTFSIKINSNETVNVHFNSLDRNGNQTFFKNGQFSTFEFKTILN